MSAPTMHSPGADAAGTPAPRVPPLASSSATPVPVDPDLMVPPEAMPCYDHLITEDDTPVDGIYSERLMRLLVSSLYGSWPGPGVGRTFLAMANVGVFAADRNPAIVPDFLLSLDVLAPDDPLPKKNRSYFIWRYGKPPDVALEIVSNKEGGELGDKIDIYARMGVPYYVVWDPEKLLDKKEMYHAFVLQGGKYVKHGDWFPNLNLGLTRWQGKFEGLDTLWLRWCDQAGAILLTGGERADKEAQRADKEAQRAALEAQRAALEAQRAALEAQRAEQETQRASQESQRAQRLEAKLRALGVDPNGE